jgi:hypothetical protein
MVHLCEPQFVSSVQMPRSENRPFFDITVLPFSTPAEPHQALLCQESKHLEGSLAPANRIAGGRGMM